MAIIILSPLAALAAVGIVVKKIIGTMRMAYDDATEAEEKEHRSWR